MGDCYIPTGFEKSLPAESAAFAQRLSALDADAEFADYLDELERRYRKIKATEVKKRLATYQAMQIFTDAASEIDARFRQRIMRANDIKILKQASDIVTNWLWLFPPKGGLGEKGREDREITCTLL